MNKIERARGSLAQFLTGSLGRRLGLNLFAYSLFGLATILLLLGTVIDQRFSLLEQKEIAGHVERSKAMLARFEQTALTRALDWAVWDESYDYLAVPHGAYESGNLNLSSMQNIEISGMSLVRFDGSFRKTVYFDFESGEPDVAAVAAFERVIATPAFARMMAETESKTGFIRVGDKVLVIAAAQIIRSDESGSPHGYLVMGKELKDADTSAKSSGMPGGEAPTECDLTPVVGASCAIARHSAAAEVTVDFTTDERFRVAMPRVLLAQIIDNILTNAVEAVAATGRGQGVIQIHAERLEQGSGKFVRLVIRDDGDGFAPETSSALFERGHTGRRKQQGGIGLHWCANTLNACGGSITLTSAGIGHGSTVEMLLPFASSAASADDGPSIANAA